MENYHKVLLALYACTLCSQGYDDVDAQQLGMSEREFGWALYLLQCMGLIEGCKFQPPKPGRPEKLLGVLRGGLIVTAKGVETAMALSNIDAKTKGVKEKVLNTIKDIGCDVMAGIIEHWIIG